MPSLSNVTLEINRILAQHGVAGKIGEEDLVVTDNIVWDTSEERLSKAIAQHIWPSLSSDEVFHFTTAATAEAIERTGLFRLYNLERRHHEDEIEAFCQAHGFDGYLALDANGIPLYRRELMPQMFFASFASQYVDEDSERNLWSTFGNEGARLKLRISARNPDFRRIRYAGTQPQIPLLRDINTLVETNYHRRFILRGIARLCAFYLPSEYGIEDEKRILFKKWDGFGPDVQWDGNWTYVNVPLGVDSATGYTIDILEIHSDSALDLRDKSLLTRRT
jgi:hypothetical protein